MNKLDNILVQIPGGGVFPPTDVSVNFRLVDSSNVEQVGWDRARNMYVRFKGGTMYVYMGVSRQRAVACAYQASVGKYINRRIKGRFDVIQLG